MSKTLEAEVAWTNEICTGSRDHVGKLHTVPTYQHTLELHTLKQGIIPEKRCYMFME